MRADHSFSAIAPRSDCSPPLGAMLALAQVFVHDNPRFSSPHEDRRAATAARGGGAVDDAGPVEAVNVCCVIRGLSDPNDVAATVLMLLDRLEVTAVPSLSCGHVGAAGASVEPIDQ